jgi:hypothetical protein
MAMVTLVERGLAHRVYQVIGWALGIGLIVYLPYHAGGAPRFDERTTCLDQRRRHCPVLGPGRRPGQ